MCLFTFNIETISTLIVIKRVIMYTFHDTYCTKIIDSFEMLDETLVENLYSNYCGGMSRQLDDNDQIIVLPSVIEA